MSEILANIVLEQTELNFTPEVNNINITPEAINLNVFAGGYTNGAGNNYEVQYNFGGVLTSSPQLTFNNPANTLVVGGNITTNNLTVNALGTLATANITNLNVSGNSNVNTILASGNANLPTINNGNLYTTGNANINLVNANTANITNVNATTANITNINASGNVNLGDVSNLTITGGSANYFLQTDGNGNLSWNSSANANYANFAGNVINSAQPNITSLGNLTGLTVTGNAAFSGANVALGNVANLEITGGTNGYVLQTDGAGNLSWTAMTGNAGNGTVGGSNTQIQYNDSGLFGGSTGFTFNKSSNLFNTPGALVAVGNITGANLIGPVSNLNYGTEKVNLIGAQTGTYNFDLISQAINYSTANATANLTLNFRGNSTVTLDTLLANGQSIIGTYIMTTGANIYGVTAVQVDGSAQTIKWVNGVAPSQFANSTTSYTFAVIKTSTTPTYTVLGSGTRFA